MRSHLFPSKFKLIFLEKLILVQIKEQYLNNLSQLTKNLGMLTEFTECRWKKVEDGKSPHF